MIFALILPPYRLNDSSRTKRCATQTSLPTRTMLSVALLTIWSSPVRFYSMVTCNNTCFPGTELS
ncbi:hypothetical protein J6590_080765 [Homalodisca vitripennis]|nr:hypothetical protein J6590_080765 [Homalodisca vitripennis]